MGIMPEPTYFKCKKCEKRYIPKSWQIKDGRMVCLACEAKRMKEYKKKFPWVVTYQKINYRCGKLPGYENIENHITAEILKELWARDKAHLMKQPSIDRIDPKGHYTFENCRYIELIENCRLASTGKVKNNRKIRQYSKVGDFIKEHISLSSAAREVGTSAENIYQCASRKTKSASGFVWRYL